MHWQNSLSETDLDLKESDLNEIEINSNNNQNTVYDSKSSIGTKIFDLENAIKEINRVGKKKYIAVESFKNNQQLFNLQCWALTCQTFFSKEEWQWLYKKLKYSGDFEFIYFD